MHILPLDGLESCYFFNNIVDFANSMIKRPYQNMSFSGQAGHRKPAGDFGDRKPWDRGGAGGDRRDFRDRDQRGGGSFGGGSYGGPRRSFGGGSRGGYGAERRFEEKRMFDAQCNKCGNDCQVPFRPTGQKPVYCSNCFVKPEYAGSRDSFGGRTSGSSAGANLDMKKINDQLKQLNAKLDLLIEAIGINDDEEGDEESEDEEETSDEDESEGDEEANEEETTNDLQLDPK